MLELAIGRDHSPTLCNISQYRCKWTNTVTRLKGVPWNSEQLGVIKDATSVPLCCLAESQDACGSVSITSLPFYTTLSFQSFMPSINVIFPLPTHQIPQDNDFFNSLANPKNPPAPHLSNGSQPLHRRQEQIPQRPQRWFLRDPRGITFAAGGHRDVRLDRFSGQCEWSRPSVYHTIY